jgi:glucosamine--fructose-6-phosphate aminotransferase (isomerizing)
MGLREEIFEQPEVLKRLLDMEAENVRRVARAVRQRKVEYVFLAARGTSDHAGVYAQYLWGSLNRLPVAFAAPSLFTLYSGSPRLQNALVMGISQSGQSPDVVSVIAEGRRQGAMTLVVTNDARSPLAQAAEFTLDVHAGTEGAVAATKSYTAELLTLAMLSAALREDTGEHWAALSRVPEAVSAALTLEAEAERIAAAHRAMGQCVVLGRGYHYATALEWALKLKEMAYLFADAYSASDFQHGPIAVVQPGFPVLALAASGAALADLLALLRRLRDEFGAELFILSDDETALQLGRSALRLPGGLPEWLSPLIGIVPAQLYCYHLTRAKGYDPEAPRHLRKVTLTR